MRAPATVNASPPHEDPDLDWLDAMLPRIYGYFLPRVGFRIDRAEDLTQETFLAAVRSGSVPATLNDIAPWLFTIARHRLIDHYRRQDRERRFLRQREDINDEIDQIPVPNLDLQSIAVREEIAGVLDRLKPRHRAALVVRYLDGFTSVETADLLGMSVSATESLLARARQAFRREYHTQHGGFS